MNASIPAWLRSGSEWAARLLVLGLGVVGLAYAVGYLHIVLLPIALAILLTALLSAPNRWLRGRGLPPAAAALGTLLSAVLVLAAIGTAIAPSIGGQVDDLGTGVQNGIRQATDVLADEPFNLSERDLRKNVDKYIDKAQSNSDGLTRGVTSGAVLLGEALTGLVVTLLLTFFFLKDGRAIWLWLVELVARDRSARADRLGGRIFQALSGYIRGIAAVGVADAVLIGIALLVVGVPLVVPLMILTFFGAFVPLIGAFLAGLAAVLIALAAKGLTAAVIILVAILVVQQLEGHVLYPLLMSRAVHLHPAAIVLALATGGVVAGLVGVFLAVPVAAAISTTIAFAREPEPPPVEESAAEEPAADEPASVALAPEEEPASED